MDVDVQGVVSKVPEEVAARRGWRTGMKPAASSGEFLIE